MMLLTEILDRVENRLRTDLAAGTFMGFALAASSEGEGYRPPLEVRLSDDSVLHLHVGLARGRMLADFFGCDLGISVLLTVKEEDKVYAVVQVEQGKNIRSYFYPWCSETKTLGEPTCETSSDGFLVLSCNHEGISYKDLVVSRTATCITLKNGYELRISDYIPPEKTTDNVVVH